MLGELENVFFGPAAGPIWAGLTALLIKGIDLLKERRKTQRDDFAEVNSAHANLNKSLQAAFETMRAEMARMREDKEISDKRYEARIAELEAELERLQERARQAGLAV